MWIGHGAVQVKGRRTIVLSSFRFLVAIFVELDSTLARYPVLQRVKALLNECLPIANFSPELFHKVFLDRLDTACRLVAFMYLFLVYRLLLFFLRVNHAHFQVTTRSL